MRFLLLATLLAYAAGAAAAVASGRNWSIAIDSLRCEAGSVLVIATKVRYLGLKGAVEAPANELIDSRGSQIRPRSLVWKGGPRELARWLPTGGLANVQSELVGDVQLKFDVGDATGALLLAFGDIPAFALTRKDAPSNSRVCANLVAPGQLQLPLAPQRAAASEPPKLRVYREAYPCLAPGGELRTIEANQPPYLPRQMLLFGLRFLPSARQVDLPWGKAPAQTYLYSGADALVPVEDAARRAVADDFPVYRAGLITAPASSSSAKKFFAFNWGVQKSVSGNQLYPIALYDVRACAK